MTTSLLVDAAEDLPGQDLPPVRPGREATAAAAGRDDVLLPRVGGDLQRPPPVRRRPGGGRGRGGVGGRRHGGRAPAEAAKDERRGRGGGAAPVKQAERRLAPLHGSGAKSLVCLSCQLLHARRSNPRFPDEAFPRRRPSSSLTQVLRYVALLTHSDSHYVLYYTASRPVLQSFTQKRHDEATSTSTILLMCIKSA